MGETPHYLDDRQARAERWLDNAHARMVSTVEPEWWLRMICGQLAEEISLEEESGLCRIARRLRAGLHWRGQSVHPKEDSWW
jgi:hypothetical protein